MSSPSYVWEKMYVAIDCLCRDGLFKSRLENATTSALIKLEDNYLTGELGEDLKFILNWTKHNIVDGNIQRLPDEMEIKQLIEKMIHVMLETHQK